MLCHLLPSFVVLVFRVCYDYQWVIVDVIIPPNDVSCDSSMVATLYKQDRVFKDRGF